MASYQTCDLSHRLGPNAINEGYKGNSIRTSKYNIVTFLPFFLYAMFSRIAYLYFLCQASVLQALPLQGFMSILPKHLIAVRALPCHPPTKTLWFLATARQGLHEAKCMHIVC